MAALTKSILGLSPAGFHRIVYSEWGVPAAQPTIVCVHGLTRNAGDFDALAGALARSTRVVCPDVVGRGRSDWLADPLRYGYPQYLADMTALLARLDVPEVDWVGTSMGGLIGMLLAAQPKAPIRRLVLNDVGPFIPKAALERIAAYVGTDPAFSGIQALEAWLRVIAAPFGALTDAQWRHFAECSARLRPDGRLGLAYDPAISQAFTVQPIGDVDLWATWDAIRCPVLILRGAHSDLLLAETAREMTTRGPPTRVVEIADAGHAPALLAEDQIAVVRDFLFAEA